MPYQSGATLIIIGACFNAVAGLVGGIHYLAYGVSLGCRKFAPVLTD